MTWLMVVFMFILLLGAGSLSFQVFKITEIDARSRGFKHPKFWGLFSLGGNNGSGGLLLYLIGRRKYPSTMSEEDKAIIESRKKRAGVSLVFIVIGSIFMFISILFMPEVL